MPDVKLVTFDNRKETCGVPGDVLKVTEKVAEKLIAEGAAVAVESPKAAEKK